MEIMSCDALGIAYELEPKLTPGYVYEKEKQEEVE